MDDSMTGAIPPRRTSTATAPRPSQPPKQERQKHTPRKQAVLELISAATVPLAALATAQAIRYPDVDVSPYALDLDTISRHSEPLADAIVDLSDNYPVLGAALDKMAVATPFAALFGVAISLGAQLAENHGKLPEHMRGISPNIVDRYEYAAELKRQGEELAAQRQRAAHNGS